MSNKIQKVPFENLEETRLFAGYFVRDLCEILGITERSYYRWKAEGLAPKSVAVAVELICGNLDHLGWKGWYIFDGKLYSKLHHSKDYHWSPGELLEARFRQLNKTPILESAQEEWRNRKFKNPSAPITSIPVQKNT